MEGLTNDALWCVFKHCLSDVGCWHGHTKEACSIQFTKEQRCVFPISWMSCESEVSKTLSLVCKRWRSVVQRYTRRIREGKGMLLRNKRQLYNKRRAKKAFARGYWYKDDPKYHFVSLK